jgi:hypothetical protein
MAGRQEFMEICCDAPPYLIVRACEWVGFRSPLDVRWCPLALVPDRPDGQQATLGLRLWNWFSGGREPCGKTCFCGKRLPRLEQYSFTHVNGDVTVYHLGQCRRCRSLFWEAA